jgi:hypothetical protein
VLVTIFASTCLLTSCRDRHAGTDDTLKKAREDQYELVLIEGYYSPDIQKAEQSLLGLAELYSSPRFAKVDGVKGTLALTHTRLYLLYSQTQRTNDAAARRTEALKLVRLVDQTEEQTWAELLHAVDALDKNRPVKWKARH